MPNIYQDYTKQSTYLKYNRLVVFAQVECKDVGVHESLSALTQDVDGLLQKLNFDPRHVMKLHCLHALFHGSIQLHCTHTNTE